MNGRHSSPDATRQAPASRQVALAVAPVAAIALAVGCGAAGLVTNRAELSAVGAGLGVGAVAMERNANRRARRRLRRERSDLRAQVGDLESLIASLVAELERTPLVPQPETPAWPAAPVAPTSLPIRVPGASAAAAAPATVPAPLAPALGSPLSAPLGASLPGVTAVGLPLSGPLSLPAALLPPPLPTASTPVEAPQPAAAVPPSAPESLPPAALPAVRVPSTEPVLVSPLGLPAQRPPATPITGLSLASLFAEPGLPSLPPGPSSTLSGDPTPAFGIGLGGLAVPMPSGPATPAGGLRMSSGGAAERSSGELVIVGAGRSRREIDQAVRSAGRSAAAVSSTPAPGAMANVATAPAEQRRDLVVDVRSRSALRPLTSFAPARVVEEEVFAEISAQMSLKDQDELRLADETSPRRRQIGLFQPMNAPASIDADALRRNASSARDAARGLRRQGESMASPFFTPGAFEELDSQQSGELSA